MIKETNRSYLVYVIITLVVVMLTMIGCKKEATPTPTSTSPGAKYTIDVANKSGIGDYLVDGAGMTLYRYTGDSYIKSTVSQDLLKDWPIFSTSKYTVPSKLDASDFSNSIINYGSGSNGQTCYKGWPLYYSDLDKKPGDTFGNVKSGFLIVSQTLTPAPTNN